MITVNEVKAALLDEWLKLDALKATITSPAGTYHDTATGKFTARPGGAGGGKGGGGKKGGGGGGTVNLSKSGGGAAGGAVEDFRGRSFDALMDNTSDWPDAKQEKAHSQLGAAMDAWSRKFPKALAAKIGPAFEKGTDLYDTDEDASSAMISKKVFAPLLRDFKRFVGANAAKYPELTEAFKPVKKIEHW